MEKTILKGKNKVGMPMFFSGQIQTTKLGQAKEILVWDAGDKTGETIETDSLLLADDGRWILVRCGSAIPKGQIEFVGPEQVCAWIAQRSASS